jgi:hypothetical protein
VKWTDEDRLYMQHQQEEDFQGLFMAMGHHYIPNRVNSWLVKTG